MYKKSNIWPSISLVGDIGDGGLEHWLVISPVGDIGDSGLEHWLVISLVGDIGDGGLNQFQRQKAAARNVGSLPASVGSTMASESHLRSAGTLLSRVRALPPAPWPDGGPESLRTPCGLAI
ncbi:hypothetical protein PoB_006432200 [Plakobranchus ocellatus]|uniref:Uncharacterized protein n=1 Tax=Plakobranchus ocellatus TaxID=259542 RepID=A0AAV4D0W4_9GAST|nr:hypothetical protein PoB_006432200 [Plakobranchus ocellatus]